MKVLGNAAALLAAISIMIAILFVQRDYQNSWHEPDTIQRSSPDTVSTVELQQHNGDRIVMK